MIVTTKRVVTIEMDNADFDLLLHTLDCASKVRSRLWPKLNLHAGQFRERLTEGRGQFVMGPVDVDFAAREEL